MQKVLEKFGLNNKEAKIYLAALELGFCSVRKIAQKVKLNRGITYEILKGLIKKGLVSYLTKGQRRYFIPEDPIKILEILGEQKREIEDRKIELTKLLPELRAIYNRLEKKPKMRFYEGVEGIKTLYEDTLTTPKGHEILSYGWGYTLPEIIPGYEEKYIKKRIERGIKIKVIAPEAPSVLKHAKRDKQELREMKIIPMKKFPFEVEKDIYENKVAIISLKDLMGVIIESSEIAETEKLIFELTWLGAERYKIKK